MQVPVLADSSVLTRFLLFHRETLGNELGRQLLELGPWHLKGKGYTCAHSKAHSLFLDSIDVILDNVCLS